MSFLHHPYTILILACSFLLGQLQAIPGDSGIHFTTREVGVPIQIVDTDVYPHHCEYIVKLEDDSFAAIQIPPFEDKTFWEWCTGATHRQPDDRFFFQVETWALSTYVQLYEYTYDDASAQKIFGDNASSICNRYNLLMYNADTNQFLFCRTITSTKMPMEIEFGRKAIRAVEEMHRARPRHARG